jgi:hypothetical protein
MNISVYPVPFHDLVHIESDRVINTIEFLNVLGESVLLQKCGKASADIQTDQLKPGLYFARIILSDGKMKTYTIVKDNR